MSELSDFLTGLGWPDVQSEPIAGDLSPRTYRRLQRAGGETTVLMESPADQSLSSFVVMTNWLRESGLSAPQIFGKDIQNGWLLLEDFGDALFSQLIHDDASTQSMLYQRAVEVLLHIRKRPPPKLAEPSLSDFLEATSITLEWYPNADRASFDAMVSHLGDILVPVLSVPPTVSLRDFHADNMMWLPDREGVKRVGLLDYQDAILTHPAYDLMSLLTDARTEVPVEIVESTLRAYADQSGDSLGALRKAVAVLGVQRNLRILGVFFRAARRDQKAHRLPAVPRVRDHLSRCLEHPVFEPVRAHLDRALPRPPAS